MTAHEHVEEAKKWAEMLILANMNGPGDTIAAATDRAARRSGVPKSLLNKLRYKRPDDICLREYLMIRDAWLSHKAMTRW